MCGNCGHSSDRHLDDKCPIYTYPGGWCKCTQYVPYSEIAPVIHTGRAALRKLYDDTKNWSEKSVRDAAAKKRTRPSLGMAERMKLGGFRFKD
jgi:hypothetical protein